MKMKKMSKMKKERGREGEGKINVSKNCNIK